MFIGWVFTLIYLYSWIPYPLYIGFVFSNVVFDNGNIGYVLLMGMLFPLIDWTVGFECNLLVMILLFTVLLLGMILCLIFLSLLYLFITYELLLYMLCIILFLFIPSYYRARTAFYLFLYSVCGSIGFIIGILFVLLLTSSLFLVTLFIIIPFYIKIPCFPFFYWLPEVHCEVNSSISLFLAGLLLKLGVFGFVRFILCSFFLSLGFLCSFILSFTLLGMIIVSCSCFRYFDFKKIIAFSSILHLNLSILTLYSFSFVLFHYLNVDYWQFNRLNDFYDVFYFFI